MAAFSTSGPLSVRMVSGRVPVLNTHRMKAPRKWLCSSLSNGSSFTPPHMEHFRVSTYRAPVAMSAGDEGP